MLLLIFDLAVTAEFKNFQMPRPSWPKFTSFVFFVRLVLAVLGLVGAPILFFGRGSSARLGADHGTVETCGRRRQIVAGVAYIFGGGVPVAAGVFWAGGRERLVRLDEEGVWWVAPVLRARLQALILLGLLLAVEWGVLGFGSW